MAVWRNVALGDALPVAVGVRSRVAVGVAGSMGVAEGRAVELGVREGLGSGRRVSVGKEGTVRVAVGRRVGELVRAAVGVEETTVLVGAGLTGVGNGTGPWPRRLYQPNKNAASVRSRSAMPVTPCGAP